jgi:hypothetical protein
VQLAIRHFGKDLTRAIAAVGVSLLACLLASDRVAAKEFPPVGDRGDAQAADQWVELVQRRGSGLYVPIAAVESIFPYEPSWPIKLSSRRNPARRKTSAPLWVLATEISEALLTKPIDFGACVLPSETQRRIRPPLMRSLPWSCFVGSCFYRDGTLSDRPNCTKLYNAPHHRQRYCARRRWLRDASALPPVRECSWKTLSIRTANTATYRWMQ